MYLRYVLKLVKVFLIFQLIFWFHGCASHNDKNDFHIPVSLTVLFFNDLHGYLTPFVIKNDQGIQEEVGGIARMAALVQDIREENKRRNVQTILLMAGDLLHGTPMSTVFRGEPDIKCLNAMRVNAATVGNHEFDFGLENFLNLQEQADFPFLTSNIVKKDGGGLLCRPFLTIKLEDNLSLTIIGVTTRELLTTTKADNVAMLDVLDPVASVVDVYDQVKSIGPVILLSHSRHQTDREIATTLPDLAAIIGGHDQILLSPYRLFGNVPVFQAFEKGRYLGRIDLEIDPVSKKAQVIQSSYIPITAGMSEDPQIAVIVADYNRRLGNQFKEVIGRSESFLDGERERVRYEETALGNFVADIMTANTGAQIGLINSGALRASIKEGDITVEDVFKAMPYANELVTTKLTGEELEDVLIRSVKGKREDEDGGFLQVSGISFEVHGHQVSDIRVGAEQQPLITRTIYSVVIPDFLSTGGDDYTIFKGKEYFQTRLPLRELVVDTIRQRGVITSEKEGRIRRIE